MGLVVRLVVALLLGALTYFVSHLLFNEPISMILALLVGIVAFFSYDNDAPFWRR